jgi:hypothetical protein
MGFFFFPLYILDEMLCHIIMSDHVGHRTYIPISKLKNILFF